MWKTYEQILKHCANNNNNDYKPLTSLESQEEHWGCQAAASGVGTGVIKVSLWLVRPAEGLWEATAGMQSRL